MKKLYSRNKDVKILFCDNETNTEKLGKKSSNKYFKDGLTTHHQKKNGKP
jgi:hypothetical protein